MFEEAKQGFSYKLRNQVIRLTEDTGCPSAALVWCEPSPVKDSPRNRLKSPLKDAMGETFLRCNICI